jgi:hypothetical protein
MLDFDLNMNKNQARNYHHNFKEKLDTHSDSDQDKNNKEDHINFHKADVVGEGPLSQVLKAVDLKTGKYYALKVFKIPP